MSSADRHTRLRGGAPPLTPGHILDLARMVAEMIGLDGRDATQIRFTDNAVVRLPRAGAVVRIPGSGAIEQNIDTILYAATILAAHRVPAIESFPGLLQPIWVEGRNCTVWKDAEDGTEPPRPHHLAGILLRLHAIRGPQPFPEWRPVDRLRQRMQDADGVGAADLQFLSEQCDLVQADLKGLGTVEPLLPRGLIHGDAELGNLIPSSAGPVICDFDATSIGPREWDLTPVAVEALRMGHGSAVHAEFVATYGVDVMRWAGFPLLRRIRELQSVIGVLPALGVHPHLKPQWQHRISTLQRGDTTATWTPYAGPV